METTSEQTDAARNVSSEEELDSKPEVIDQPEAVAKAPRTRISSRKPRKQSRRVASNAIQERLFSEFLRTGSLPEAARLCGIHVATAYRMRSRLNFDKRIEDSRQAAVKKSGLTLESANLETLNMLRVVKQRLHAEAKAWQGVAEPEPGKPNMKIDDLSEQIRELAKTEQLLLGGVTDRVGVKTWEEEVAEAARDRGVN